MTMDLYPYQTDAVQRARQAIAEGKRRLILVAATGSGKTVIAASIIRSACAKNKRVLFIAHRTELITQASKKLDAFGVDHGIIMGQHWRRRPHLSVQVASVQTLARRDLPTADIIIIDEAHLSMAKSYVSVIEAYPNAVVLGLTATPIRHDGRPLGALYHDMITVSSVPQLIRMGFLVRPIHYAPERPDLTKVSTTRGDYDETELAAALDRADLVGNIVDHWIQLANGRTTGVFAINIQHSQHIVRQFLARGVQAEHVDGTTPRHQREQLLRRFESGETPVVSNVGIFTEGYDNPRMSAVILARPTMSLALYLQMVGRGLRTFPGKGDAVILDHAGCTFAHDLANKEREWSLEGKKKRATLREAPVTVCPQCFAAYAIQKSSCPECGHTTKQSGEREEIKTDESKSLVLMDEQKIIEARRAKRMEVGRAQTLDELLKIARERGYKAAWAYKRMAVRRGKHA